MEQATINIIIPIVTGILGLILGLWLNLNKNKTR